MSNVSKNLTLNEKIDVRQYMSEMSHIHNALLFSVKM
jgi:hypothetical protein